MNEVLKSMLNWVLIFAMIIFGTGFLLNFYMQGLFLKYVRVKASRGKKVMVQVDTLVDRYLAVGHIEEGFLVYKKRFSKINSRLAVPDGGVYRTLGIHWINVDEKKNAIMKADYSVVEGHDAELTEALFIKGLNRPSINDNKTKVLIVLLVIVIAGVIVLGVMTAQIYKKVVALNTI